MDSKELTILFNLAIHQLKTAHNKIEELETEIVVLRNLLADLNKMRCK